MTDEDRARRLDDSPRADAARRAARQRELGLAKVPDERFDELARRIAELTGAPIGLVNLVGDKGQYFTGMHVAADTPTGEATFVGEGSREMNLGHGFCTRVVARRKPLVLDDVFDYPRLAANPVVDTPGVRSYIGAPLIDDDGTVFGTVCAIAPVAHGAENEWGARGLELIKRMADEVMAEIRDRQRIDAITAAAPGPVMVVTRPRLDVLHANAHHEKMFGKALQLGDPVTATFPGVETFGLPATLDRVVSTGTTAVSPPVRLVDGGTALFAAVPASLPGHSTAILTLGMRDTAAAECAAIASDLVNQLAKLTD